MTTEELYKKYGDIKVLVLHNNYCLFTQDGCSPLGSISPYIIEKLAEFKPRYLMETDTAYRQVIPYLIVTYEDMVFITKRKDGDGRLIGKLSCGIGGHIELCDTTWTNSSILKEALKRELEEELVIDYNTQVKSCKPIGLLCCNETEVDKVHIGIVYNVEVTTFDIQVRETDTLEGGFIFKHHALERLDENWETWSKLCLTKLIGGGYCG